MGVSLGMKAERFNRFIQLANSICIEIYLAKDQNIADIFFAPIPNWHNSVIGLKRIKAGLTNISLMICIDLCWRVNELMM